MQENNYRFRHYTLKTRNNSNGIYFSNDENSIANNSLITIKEIDDELYYPKNTFNNNPFRSKKQKSSYDKNSYINNNCPLNNISNFNSLNFNQKISEKLNPICFLKININKDDRSKEKSNAINTEIPVTGNYEFYKDSPHSQIYVDPLNDITFSNNCKKDYFNSKKDTNDINNITVSSMLNNMNIVNDQISENVHISMDIDESRLIPEFAVCDNKFASSSVKFQCEPFEKNLSFHKEEEDVHVNTNSYDNLTKNINEKIRSDNSDSIPYNKIFENTLKPSSSTSDTFLNKCPENVSEYVEDIFSYLKSLQNEHLPKKDYMKTQSDINEKMRGILIDWLIEVHLKFKLLPETLFLTINLIDRYLSSKNILRTKLQLIGVCCLFIACKYEEIYPPEIKDFVFITDKAYTKEEIIEMETDILRAVNFEITITSSLRYLEYYNLYLDLDENLFLFSRYLLELFLLEYKMIKYNYNLLAASSIYITFKITKRSYIDKIFLLSGLSEEKLRECSKDICFILDRVETSSLQAVRKKFSLPKFNEVAKFSLF